ncbi:uncharacterized protein [Ptychodera flava]|uniref:uncharacterized protein isoform X2 n=1 Tax=Ptychodera flava TaxID=63121 RepID=UPI00396A713A
MLVPLLPFVQRANRVCFAVLTAWFLLWCCQTSTVASLPLVVKCPPGYFKVLDKCMNCSICTEISEKECRVCGETTPISAQSKLPHNDSTTVTDTVLGITVEDTAGEIQKNSVTSTSTVSQTPSDIGNLLPHQGELIAFITLILLVLAILAYVIHKCYKKKRRPHCPGCAVNHGNRANANHGCIYHNVDGGRVRFTSSVTHDPVQPEEDNTASVTMNPSINDDIADQSRRLEFPSVLKVGTNRQYQCSRETSV